LELGERFLTQLAASAMTASQMEKVSSATLSNGEITNTVLQLTLTPKWKNEKLKHTALLVLGTLLRAHLFNTGHDSQENTDLTVRHSLILQYFTL